MVLDQIASTEYWDEEIAEEWRAGLRAFNRRGALEADKAPPRVLEAHSIY